MCVCLRVSIRCWSSRGPQWVAPLLYDGLLMLKWWKKSLRTSGNLDELQLGFTLITTSATHDVTPASPPPRYNFCQISEAMEISHNNCLNGWKAAAVGLICMVLHNSSQKWRVSQQTWDTLSASSGKVKSLNRPFHPTAINFVFCTKALNGPTTINECQFDFWWFSQSQFSPSSFWI